MYEKKLKKYCWIILIPKLHSGIGKLAILLLNLDKSLWTI